jgi:hypothetical protein
MATPQHDAPPCLQLWRASVSPVPPTTRPFTPNLPDVREEIPPHPPNAEGRLADRFPDESVYAVGELRGA